MPLRRGDIVLVRVPDTSGAPGKTRPALVVSADRSNQRLQDVILAVITSTTRRAQLEPTQFLFELRTPEGARSGLLTDSAVKCERLHALLQSLALRTVGALSPTAMQQIDICLKAALGLP